MGKKIAVNLIAVIAVLSLLAAVLLWIFTDNPSENQDVVVRTPSQMLFGLSYKTQIECDMEKVEDYVLSDSKFTDYVLKDEYSMIYQINNEAELEAAIEALGLKGELPAVDYRNNKLLLSIGRELEALTELKKSVSDTGDKMVNPDYGEEYHHNTVFVYTTRNIKLVSGNELELYYLEKLDDKSNLEEGIRDGSELISSGEYHKLYKKDENVYEYILVSSAVEGIAARAITSLRPEITEISPTLIKIVTGNITVYYNSVLNIFSDKIPRETIHLDKDVVAFVKEQNGEVRLVIRHVYDLSKYVMNFGLPFTENYDVVDSVLESIKLIDPTHVEVEYYTGTNRILKTEVLRIVEIK